MNNKTIAQHREMTAVILATIQKSAGNTAAVPIATLQTSMYGGAAASTFYAAFKLSGGGVAVEAKTAAAIKLTVAIMALLCFNPLKTMSKTTTAVFHHHLHIFAFLHTFTDL